MKQEPMESHGLRLPPAMWRRIEYLARCARMDRSAFVRKQLDASLLLVPEFHSQQEVVLGAEQGDGDLFIPEEAAE